MIQEDLQNIFRDYEQHTFIAGPYEALYLATFAWDSSPQIIWYQDYLASVQGKELIREYRYEFRPDEIPLNNLLVISGEFERFDKYKKYENEILISAKSDLTIEGFSLDRCYRILCVYKTLE